MMVEVDGGLQLLPEIVQCVVIAADMRTAFDALKESNPKFNPVGSATLQDYEKVAARLRAIIRGEVTDDEWPVLIAPEMRS